MRQSNDYRALLILKVQNNYWCMIAERPPSSHEVWVTGNKLHNFTRCRKYKCWTCVRSPGTHTMHPVTDILYIICICHRSQACVQRVVSADWEKFLYYENRPINNNLRKEELLENVSIIAIRFTFQRLIFHSIFRSYMYLLPVLLISAHPCY